MGCHTALALHKMIVHLTNGILELKCPEACIEKETLVFVSEKREGRVVGAMMGYVCRDYWGDNKNWIIKNKSEFARQMQIRGCICVYWGGRWNKCGGRGVILEWAGMKLWPTSQLCLAVNFPACIIRPHITAWFFFFWMSTWEVYLFSNFQFHRTKPFQSVESPSDLHSELDETEIKTRSLSNLLFVKFMFNQVWMFFLCAQLPTRRDWIPGKTFQTWELEVACLTN